MKEFQEVFVSAGRRSTRAINRKVLRDRIDASDFVYRVLSELAATLLGGEVSATTRTVEKSPLQ